MISVKHLGGAAIFLAGIGLGSIIGYFFVEEASSNYSFLRNLETINECLGTNREKVIFASETHSSQISFCYAKIHNQGLLNDFMLRRHSFQTQHFADVVLLWMVVFITLSGIALAALQLLGSFRLASAFGPEGAGLAVNQSLTIENGKIALRSSVTGLFILLISLGFFYLYIAFVYKIQIVDDRSTSVQTAYSKPTQTEAPSGDYGSITSHTTTPSDTDSGDY